jgi:hypothetical protein
MTSDAIIEDYDFIEYPKDKLDKTYILSNNIMATSFFYLSNTDKLNKKYIVLVADNHIKVVNPEINKEPQNLKDPYYFGCEVEAPNEYIAVFEAGKKLGDLENS